LHRLRTLRAATAQLSSVAAARTHRAARQLIDCAAPLTTRGDATPLARHDAPRHSITPRRARHSCIGRTTRWRASFSRAATIVMNVSVL
jgi:hypothetical protein